MIDEKKLIEFINSNEFNLRTIKSSKSIQDVLLEFIEEQPKIGEWVPCSEPPKYRNEVLIFNGKSYSVGYYDGKTWVNTIHPVEWQEIHHK